MRLAPDSQPEHQPAWVFRTPEEIEAAAQGRLFAYYLRTDHPLCAAALKTPRSPADKRAMLKVFPFIRHAAAFHLPLTPSRAGDWLLHSFFAGFLYACDYYTKAEEISEQTSHGGEKARPLLHRLASDLGQRKPTLDNLSPIFASIAAESPPKTTESTEQFWVRMALTSILAGFAAVTVAPADPGLVGFVHQLPFSLPFEDLTLVQELMVYSLIAAEEKAFAEFVRHPFLLLAHANYQAKPVEQWAIIPFFHQQLAAFNVRSGDECPVADADLEKWIYGGLEYSLTLLTKQPETVDRVYSEYTPNRLRELKSLGAEIHKAAGRLEPQRLVEPLLKWHQQTYGWRKPNYYGRALMRVVHLADFAVWLPWLLIV